MLVSLHLPCFFPHGCKMAGAAPAISSMFKAGRGGEKKRLSVASVLFYEETKAFPEVSPADLHLHPMGQTEQTLRATHTFNGDGESVYLAIRPLQAGAAKVNDIQNGFQAVNLQCFLQENDESREWEGEKWETAGEMGCGKSAEDHKGLHCTFSLLSQC